MENPSSERIEKLLAMILVHQMGSASQAEKSMALSRAGFANADIAMFLGASAGTVAQQLYELRKGGKGSSKKAKK